MAWVAFNAPHTPFHTPPVSLHSYGSAPATNLLKYQAAVEAMDTEIGRLLAAVNLTETDVIFIGDNGTPSSVIRPPYDSTHAKDSLYEGGVRVPLIIRGPSVNQAGRSTDTLVHCVDIFRTVLDMLDVAIPASTLDSRSMVPILGNQSNATRSRLYSEKFDQSDAVVGGRIIRDDRYKLLRSNAGNDEFYDLQIDPAETTNLFAGGRTGLNVTQRARYDRLRFNFSDFSSLSSVAPVTHGIVNGNFFLSVPDLANYRESLWTCSDLDYWAPAENVASAVQGGHATFSQAIDPAKPRKFFSVLRESE
jgi:arylsulfatase A-like enzyme